MKKMMLVVVAIIAAIFMIGATHTTASADSVYKRIATTEIENGDAELLGTIEELAEELMTKMMNGEIDRFEFNTEKDGQIYVETFKKGKLFTKSEKIYTDYYIELSE